MRSTSWDGGGYPDGLRRDGIPILGRIIGLAQAVEIFASEENPARATEPEGRETATPNASPISRPPSGIGKLSVPNRILDKPGKLTPGEWEVIKLHPQHTFQILERVPVFGDLAFDASAHHERLDGRGYYRNLSGAHLSQTARILATADQLDALSAERPYRGTLPRERVIAILREERGTGLCPDAVEAAETILTT